MKPFLKYVYALHILLFLSYNQQFIHGCGSALNAGAGRTSGSQWYTSQPVATPKFEAIICVEELKENDDNEQYTSSRDENTLLTFFNGPYNFTGHKTGISSSGSIPHLNELRSLYLLFLVLRL